MTRPRWTREPLVHFLIIGAVIYVGFALGPREIDPASRTIEIDRQMQAQLAVGFERTMGRPPTDSELDRRIEQYVREEVLYREALRLGLDQDDAAVRRRMAKKMDMLASAQAETAQPTETQLQDWLAAHPERFTGDARYSFEQVYFEDRPSAQAALERSRDAGGVPASSDAISLPASVSDEARKSVTDRFGRQFVAEMDALEPGEGWQGPLASGFGWHLVRLTRRDAGEVPQLVNVREQVESDWRSSTVKARKEEGYAILREDYRIEIDR